MKKVNVIKKKAINEWAKHLRPYGKRQVNKAVRQYGKKESKGGLCEQRN